MITRELIYAFRYQKQLLRRQVCRQKSILQEVAPQGHSFSPRCCFYRQGALILGNWGPACVLLLLLRYQLFT